MRNNKQFTCLHCGNDTFELHEVSLRSQRRGLAAVIGIRADMHCSACGRLNDYSQHDRDTRSYARHHFSDSDSLYQNRDYGVAFLDEDTGKKVVVQHLSKIEASARAHHIGEHAEIVWPEEGTNE